MRLSGMPTADSHSMIAVGLPDHSKDRFSQVAEPWRRSQSLSWPFPVIDAESDWPNAGFSTQQCH
jgi:hypothetical protein